MIDVNARPFSSIGHLFDYGINLPFLAVSELLKTPVVDARDQVPKHTYWIDFSQDLYSAASHIKSRNLSITKWIAEIYKARSYAYFNATDPLPMLVVFFRLTRHWTGSIFRRAVLLAKSPFK